MVSSPDLSAQPPLASDTVVVPRRVQATLHRGGSPRPGSATELAQLDGVRAIHTAPIIRTVKRAGSVLDR